MAFYHPIKCLLLTLLLSVYYRTNSAQEVNTTQPEVTIPQGTLVGTIMTTRKNRNFSAFSGIPYAQPPIGSLRFANPVAADNWNGTLDASVEGSMCPQMSGTVMMGSEDCLFLNVYTPQLPQDTNSTLLPVMVFIHGGAFAEGSATADRIGPGYLLDEDVLYVAANYRVGIIGFLSTGDEFASGNWGLKDQVVALEWVRDNIRYFGGDPDQVTLFGESAGAGAVHLLTLSDATEGLFHRYITQSGSALSKWAHRPRAAFSERAFELGGYAGCDNDTSESLISCLRGLDVYDVMATQSDFVVWRGLPDILWGPTDEPDIEGALLTDSPKNLFAAGKVRDLPWIAGIVRDEGLVHTAELYADEEILYDFLENIDTLLPIMMCWMYESDVGASFINATKSYYFNNDFTSDTSVLLKNLTMLIGDSHFYYPTRKGLQQQLAIAQNPQYFYTFDYRGTFSCSYIFSGSAADVGVAHGDDLLYLFPSESAFSRLNETMTETDYEIVDTMIQLWTSFAINGTPTASGLDGITWDPYSTSDNYLRIGNNSDKSLEMQSSFFEERMQFWDSLYATAETEATENSGTVTFFPNLLFVLLVACAEFVL